MSRFSNRELDALQRRAREKWQRYELARKIDTSRRRGPSNCRDSLLHPYLISKLSHTQLIESAVLQTERDNVIHHVIDITNKSLSFHHIIVKTFIFILCALLAMTPVFAETISGIAKLILLTSAAAIFCVFQWCQIWDKKLGVNGLLQRSAMRTLLKIARKHGISSKLQDMQIQYKKGKFFLSDKS